MNQILEFVTLALYDHGPLTLSELSAITCLPLPSLRTHLQVNRGERYLATLTLEDGLPIRRWALMPAPTQEIE